MGLTLKCPIEGCSFEIDAFTTEEAISKARNHAKTEHNMSELPPHIIDKITTAFKPQLW